MSLFEKILFPVDFSVRSRATAKAVAAFAARNRAHVSLLHVCRFPPEIRRLSSEEVHERMEIAYLGHMQSKLDTYLTDVFPFNTPRLVSTGEAAEEIIRRAERGDCDLIMMPTHGHSKFREMLLGSVTARVLHDVMCPVWTTAHASDGAVPVDYKNILCAIDMGENSEGVLRWGKSLAELWGAKLHVTHAVPTPNSLFANAASKRAHEFRVDTAKAKYRELAEKHGWETPLHLAEEESLGRCMQSAVQLHKADLLVIARGALEGTLGRLRTSAHEIIRVSPCPVLSV